MWLVGAVGPDPIAHDQPADGYQLGQAPLADHALGFLGRAREVDPPHDPAVGGPLPPGEQHQLDHLFGGVLRAHRFDAVHPLQPHLAQHADGLDAPLGPEGGVRALAQAHGVVAADKAGREQLFRLGMIEVAGVGHQRHRHLPAQPAAHLEQAGQGIAAGGHQVEGVRALGRTLAGPGEDIRLREFDRLGEQAGPAGERAEGAVHGTGFDVQADVEVHLALVAEGGSGQVVGRLHQGVGLPALQVETHELQGLVPFQGDAVATLGENGFDRR